ncbi:MAG: response regulator transcription factor [Chloroflexi bacterium]|nr:MAG: response regulator transcription factor [Chloroflexota bacterium]TMF84187.1 MAG: response regulator transcription factor [Chloroflexota bacterium]TMG13589.1 MAG: response regulator transcription factor [Chloroflexota bacterium]
MSLGSGEETHTTAPPASTITASSAKASASLRREERRPTFFTNASPAEAVTRYRVEFAQVPWDNLVAMTIKWKVALVEDDRRLARAVATGLGEEGYTVRAVDSAGRGLDLVRQWNPDVVLLDLMLPDNEGPELFEAFRAETDAALVGISARSSVSDRIAGLKLGADDYVTKPFALEELMARVEAVIRRHRGKGGARLSAADVMVDLSEGIATRAGRRLSLTGIEFRILTALMRNSGQLVTYAQLAEAVWAVTTGPESNSLEVHISRIRQKLEQDGRSRLIQTVRGLGYRFGTE